LYRDSDGRQLARAAQETDVESAEGQRDLAGLVVRLLCRDAAYELRKTAAADPEMLTIFERVSADDKMARAIVAPLANDHRAQRSLLAGLELLERSLQSAKKQQGVSAAIDDETAVRDLKDAVSHFSQSLEFEPSNPLTHLLLANCYFNLGQTDTLDDWAVRHLESLQGAHQFAETWEDSHPIKIEIEAEFALLVNRDYRRAVELYRQLADTRSHHNGRFALRSRWMLAGIHLGDWGAISYSPDVLDVEAAREHIIAILANWPNSPEAKFYQNCLDNPTVPVGHGTLAQSR
jgi:tetratricopeptide (TPR) repeat protein